MPEYPSSRHIHHIHQILYTTGDELDYVRQLHAAAKVRVDLGVQDPLKSLRLYLETAVVRRWHGDGMNVDPAQCIKLARTLLEELTAREKMKRLSDEMAKAAREASIKQRVAKRIG